MSSSIKLAADGPATSQVGKNLAIVMLCMAVLGEMCLAADFYGFASVLSLVSSNLHLTESEAGLVQGAFGVSYALGMLFWAPQGRKMSSRTLYLIGLGGSGALMIAQSYANTFAELIILRLIIGFFDSAVWVGSMKIVMQWFSPKRQGLVMGIILGAYSLAITLDFALGLPYAMTHSWRAFFVALGVLTLAVTIIAQIVVRPGPYADPHDKIPGAGVFAAVFRSKWVWVAILGIFGDLFSIAACATWVIPAYIKTQGMNPAMAPMVGTIMGLSQIVFLLIGGYLSDKLTRPGMIKAGVILTLLSALLCVATTIWPMHMNMLLLVATLCGVGVFSGGAIFSLIGEKYGSDLGPSAAGYAEMGGVLATFVAPALMGALLTATHSFAVAFWSFVVVQILVLIALFVLLRPGSAQTAH
ncbi:MAG TPA: MFS transporter [Eoetvoesiella sp.]|uniref:MFS transporter n=1 Tax=Eoetvoesiella sp. TaxID=1966355 RepID=UPI002BDC6E2E|nr:MFS transporter [Eoetvoesiella sp.]HWK61777.1 MFS transporter [Eoetvoesiella sp.]